MSIVRRILGSLEARLSQPRLSLWRTLYVNFRLLPFKEAVKLPIFIYGKVRLFILSGKVQFNSTIYRGMVKIGVNGDSFSLFDNSGYIQLADKNSIIDLKELLKCVLMYSSVNIAIGGRVWLMSSTLPYITGYLLGNSNSDNYDRSDLKKLWTLAFIAIISFSIMGNLRSDDQHQHDLQYALLMLHTPLFLLLPP